MDALKVWMVGSIYTITLFVAVFTSNIVIAAPVATVVKLEGVADVRRNKESARPLELNDVIDEHDVVRTKRNSMLALRFKDGSEITMAENTRLVIAEYVLGDSPKGLFDVARGKIRAVVTDTFSRNKESFKTRTATAIAGVQGTDYEMHASALDTQVFVHNGTVSVRNFNLDIGGIELLTAGSAAMVRIAAAPISVDLRDAVGSEQKRQRLNERVNSGSTQDMRSSGSQIHDPNSMAPNYLQRTPLPATPNLP